MSQLSSEPLDSSCVAVPIEKFSHNTSRVETKTYTWSHIHQNDLSCSVRNVRVFNDVGVFTTKKFLRISAGAKILESKSLDELAVRFRQFHTSSAAENPIQVVIRPPIWLAMVYPKSEAMVQRIQMKFFGEADYKKIVTIFNDMGLAPKESLPPLAGASSVPPASSSPALSMFSAASSNTCFSTAPSLSRSSSSISTRLLPCVDSAIRLSNASTFRMPQMPSSTNLAGDPRSNHAPYSGSIFTRQLSTPISSSLGMPLASSAPMNLQNHVRKPSLYLPQIERQVEAAQLGETHIASQCHRTNMRFSSAVPHGDESSHGHLLRNRVLEVRQDTRSPFFPPRHSAPSVLPASHEQEVVNEMSGSFEPSIPPVPGIPRPMSHPADITAIQNLSIPPRRSLPFSKPQSSSKPRSSSLDDLPPLPRPTSVVRNESIIKPAVIDVSKVSAPVAKPMKRIAHRKPPASLAQDKNTKPDTGHARLTAKQVVLEPSQLMHEDEPSPLAAKSAATIQPASAAASLESKVEFAHEKRTATTRPSSAAKRLKMVDQSTQTLLFSIQAGVSNLSPLNDCPSTVVGVESSLASPPNGYLDELDSFIAKHKSRPAPKGLWESPEYVAAAQKERDVMLNRFICDSLSDPNFRGLCKDVEFAWRRLVLGDSRLETDDGVLR